jgi:hypothetical protein
MFRWLRDTFQPICVKEPAEYPKHDDRVSNEALLNEPESNRRVLPSASPAQKVVQFFPLVGPVIHMTSWLTTFFVDHLDIIYMSVEMGNDESTEMQLILQDLPNPVVFVTTPNVCRTGLNLRAANDAVQSQKFCILNERRQAFSQVLRLGHNTFPHTSQLNTELSGDINTASDLHRLSGLAKWRVWNGQMSQPNITTLMLYRCLECCEDYWKQLIAKGNVVPSDGKDER